MISCLRHRCGCRRTSSCTPRIVLQRLDDTQFSGPRQLAVTSRRVRSTRPLHRPRTARRVLLPLQRRRENARAKRDRTDSVSSVWSLSTFDTGQRQKLSRKRRAVDDLSFELLSWIIAVHDILHFLTSFVLPHPRTSCYQD